MSIPNECELCNGSGLLGRDPDGETVYCTCIAGLRANIEHYDTLIDAYARALSESPNEDVRIACYVAQDERDRCMDRLIEALRGTLAEISPAEAEAVTV